MPDIGSVRLPKVDTIDTCGPFLPHGEINGYKVVKAADDFRERFLRGADVVRVRRLTHRPPDYQGRNSGKRAILKHADHFGDPNDPRWMLVLSKLQGQEANGSPTLIATRDAAPFFLDIEKGWFLFKRTTFGAERNYDKRFRISREEYNLCFDDPRGYARIVNTLLCRYPRFDRTITELNVLGYLMRGPHADDVMRDVMERCAGMYIEETWDDIELIGLNNSTLVHGRKWGIATRRQRNFGV